MRYNTNKIMRRLLLFAVAYCGTTLCLKLKRNPFIYDTGNQQAVVATASLGDDSQQATFVQLRGKIRCIKKTPSTWES